jgi:hypothetical protein
VERCLACEAVESKAHDIEGASVGSAIGCEGRLQRPEDFKIRLGVPTVHSPSRQRLGIFKDLIMVSEHLKLTTFPSSRLNFCIR